MYGRHGECPMPVLAPASPGDCFYIIVEAFRIALKYMTPVIVLSEGSLATGAKPWLIPTLIPYRNLSQRFILIPMVFLLINVIQKLWQEYGLFRVR